MTHRTAVEAQAILAALLTQLDGDGIQIDKLENYDFGANWNTQIAALFNHHIETIKTVGKLQEVAADYWADQFTFGHV